MAITVLPINAASGAPAYSAQATRQAFSAFLGAAPVGRPLGAASGVRAGTPSTTVTLTGASATTWNVAAHSGVVDAETAIAGPYLYATDGSDTGTITAANATNPRIDIIYVQINDTDQDGSGLRGGVVGYLAGTAAATPSAPAAPARSIVLANINVPASGGGNPTVSWVAPTYGFANVTTGSTGATGFTITSQSYVRMYPLVFVRVGLTYNGSGITSGATGNITDTDAVTGMPFMPPANVYLNYNVGTSAGGQAAATTDGRLVLVTLSPSSSITSGTTLVINGTFSVV